MVKFGRYIEAHSKKEWKNNYIDYNKLKQKIKNMTSQRKSNRLSATEHDYSDIQDDYFNRLTRRKSSYAFTKSDFDKILESEIGKYIEEFLKLLDLEIKKFFIFFKYLERKLYKEISHKMRKEQSFRSYNLIQIMEELENFDGIINETLDLCSYINLNVTAVRKILKKFDKNFEMQENPIALYFLAKNLEDKNSGLLYILKFKIIDETSALLDKVICDLEKITERKLNSSPQYGKNNEFNDYDNILNQPLMQNLISLEELSLDKKEIIKIKINQKITNLKEKIEQIDNANNLIRSSVEIWSLLIKNHLRIIDDLRPMPDSSFLNVHKKHTFIGKNENIITNLTPQVQETQSSSKSSEWINVYICLIHTFFYMMTSAIILPTNSKYIHSIGANATLTGLVLAMTHFAAIFCTFFFSHWTNESYKKPLIFSCVCFMLGNVFYIYAGQFGSIVFMMIGRFLIGFGSARVVCRRFLIEHIEKEFIMHYSLLYVVFNAIGSLCGPLLACGLLCLNDYEFLYSIVELNQFTWPAWICLAYWTLFLPVIFIFFKDPYEEKNAIDNSKDELEKLESLRSYVSLEDFLDEDEYNQIKNEEPYTKVSTIQVADSGDLNNEFTFHSAHSFESNPKITKSAQVRQAPVTNKGPKQQNPKSIPPEVSLIDRDIKYLIREQENDIFSYMTVAFVILVAILLIIRVIFIYIDGFREFACICFPDTD